MACADRPGKTGVAFAGAHEPLSRIVFMWSGPRFDKRPVVTYLFNSTSYSCQYPQQADIAALSRHTCVLLPSMVADAGQDVWRPFVNAVRGF